ncbi:hypothetical protein DMUE_0523 [Dictyocoela muelleri]|nr:hypothetical protein DMUE_0523 [Dictyocoela muelleri]
MGLIFRIIIRYLSRQPLNSITEYFGNKRKIRRIIDKFNSMIPAVDFSSNKLGGSGCMVQIDETMINYKCKSHRGRSARNRTDAICIVEVREGIERAYARVIPDKRKSTLIPIICSKVAHESIIWTDEHRSYSGLRGLGFEHSTVIHKYEFINRATGANTQAAESFNNQVKLCIKREKGVITEKRENFLNRFCFFFNNKSNLLMKGIDIIKLI